MLYCAKQQKQCMKRKSVATDSKTTISFPQFDISRPIIATSLIAGFIDVVFIRIFAGKI